MNLHVAYRIDDFRTAPRPGLTAHLMAITHFLRKNTLDRLTESGRYRKLNLVYQGYISLLAEQDYSPGELAAKLGVSKQACSNTIRELTKLGLVQRRVNPQDSRSSLLSLTPEGLQLLHDGTAVTADIQQQFADTLGRDRLERFIDILEILRRELAIEIPSYRALEPDAGTHGPTRLNLLLTHLNDFFYQSLIDSLTAKGFEGLKPSFGQVLSLIVPDGGRIQDISSVIGVSKQAIAVTASELEQLGYIVRETDPADKRQVILRLSPQGERLLAASTTSVRNLEVSIEAALGEVDYRLLEEIVGELHLLVTGGDGRSLSRSGIKQLSRHLLEELGATDARVLARQLLAMTRGDS